MEEKKCYDCKLILPLNDFEKCKKYKDGLHYRCKVCKKKYREKNKEKIKILNKKRDYEKMKIVNKNYREKNKEKIKDINRISGKKYREKNKEKIKKYAKEYYKKNKHLKAWRDMLKSSLKRLGQKKEAATIELLGYSALELKNHIQSLFVDGMTWDNHGEWHIDHIKPVSSFPKTTHPSVVNALTNLQPLWWLDNLSKNKFIY